MDPKEILKNVKVVSMEDAEKADFCVCGWDSYFPDDITTVCSACGRKIVHRPHAPKKPPKICLNCAVLFQQAETNN